MLDKGVSSPLLSSIKKSIRKHYPGVKVRANVHESDLAYVDDIVNLSSSYRNARPAEAVNSHATAVSMRTNGSKTKVMSTLIPGEQRKAVLLNGEPLEDVDKFRYLGFMFVSNSQGTERFRSRSNLACSAFSRLQSCLWLKREMSLSAKDKVNQAVVRSILLYGCETWPVQEATEKTP